MHTMSSLTSGDIARRYDHVALLLPACTEPFDTEAGNRVLSDFRIVCQQFRQTFRVNCTIHYPKIAGVRHPNVVPPCQPARRVVQAGAWIAGSQHDSGLYGLFVDGTGRYLIRKDHDINLPFSQTSQQTGVKLQFAFEQFSRCTLTLNVQVNIATAGSIINA